MEISSSADDDWLGKLSSGWDQRFLSLSESCLKPLHWIYGPSQQDDTEHKTKTLGHQILARLGRVFVYVCSGLFILTATVVLKSISKGFRGLGFALQKEGYSHIRSSTPPNLMVNGQAKIMAWNVRGDNQQPGLLPWKERIASLVAKVQESSRNPDILIIQGARDVQFEQQFAKRLQYPNSYIHLGQGYGDTSRSMVMTKYIVDSFVQKTFSGNDWNTARGFGILELRAYPKDPKDPQDLGPCVRIISTQFSAGKGDTQLTQIINELAKRPNSIPTFLVANIEGEDLDFLTNYCDIAPPLYPEALADNEPALEAGKKKPTDVIALVRPTLPDGRILPTIDRDVKLVGQACQPVSRRAEDSKMILSDCDGVIVEVSGLKPVEREVLTTLSS